jgi:threonine aldolase
MSKGLGAPLGSVLAGSEDFIKRAGRWRKMCGGGMRQAGIVAAGALLALRDQRERLLEDHHNAALLAAGLAAIDELSVEPVYSNMVFVTCPPGQMQPLKADLQQQGIIVDGHLSLRLVTHLGINNDDVQRVLKAVGDFFAR